jgi:hypothetical protein
MSFKNWFMLDTNKNGINFNIRPALGQLKKMWQQMQKTK